MKSRIEGVIAALLLPRDEAGLPDWQGFERNARFVKAAGVSGFCVNGATGEYVSATHDEQRSVVERARSEAGESLLVVSGIGAARWSEIAANARAAKQAGADAVLAPAPHFFKYSPDDLAEYYRAIANESDLPVLIYNLPAFTGGLAPELAEQLISGCENIAGVKDSSGQLELLARLTRAGGGAVRLMGNDSALAEALRRGFCDGAISGVAGVLPELTLSIWKSAPGGELFETLSARLDEFIQQLDAFPTPWGLKLIADWRGIAPASFALPLSQLRRQQAADFRGWLKQWWDRTVPELTRVLGIEPTFQVE